MRTFTILFVFTISSLLIGCDHENSLPADYAELQVKHPSDNPPTDEKIALGKRLFFEKALSLDSSISCASCHKPALAFADSVSISPGVYGRKAFRNTPSIINVAFLPHLMMEGGVKSLELQVLAPLQDDKEMAMPIFKACKRLNNSEEYRALFELVWGDSATPFTLTRSIAAFERNLVAFSAPYDNFLLGDSASLSKSAVRGMKLFKSDRTGCNSCHSGVLFTNFQIENNGLDSVYVDKGLFRLTADDGDRGKFKVPSLRNVKLTAPYMHDGRFTSIKQVIEHYNSGGNPHPNKNELIGPINLTADEKRDLIAFLESL